MTQYIWKQLKAKHSSIAPVSLLSMTARSFKNYFKNTKEIYLILQAVELLPLAAANRPRIRTFISSYLAAEVACK